MLIGTDIKLSILGNTFFLPLLLSPFIALVLGAVVYYITHTIRLCLGVTKEYCFCVGEQEKVIPIPQSDSRFSLSSIQSIDIAMDTKENCI